eukprot:gb/GEZN01005809.1/.p1 GENE.gb/GEZN01005809.1/~~gb/GEZN01005809.1/.p1  ORF type:complete len:409 (+),score=126.37 gb/GEZN01005809.1/:103-1227(+)
MIVRLLVGDKSVGGLIGKKGVVINQLRSDTGCRIDIPKSAGGATKRVVTLEGEVDNLGLCISMICSRLHDNKTSASSSSASSSSSSTSSSSSASSSPSSSSSSSSSSSPASPGSAAAAASSSASTAAATATASATAAPTGPAANGVVEQQTITMLVDNKLVGAMIGKGGSTISQIRTSSGALIQVSEKALDNSTEKSVRISGSSQAIDTAVSYCLKLFAVNVGNDRATSMPYVPMAERAPYVDPYAAAGYGQTAYGYAQTAYGAPAFPSGVARRDGFPAGATSTVVMPVPENCVGGVIGKGGKNIEDMRRRSGATIKIAKSEGGDRNITISGTSFATELAQALINQKIQETLTGATAAGAGGTAGGVPGNYAGY